MPSDEHECLDAFLSGPYKYQKWPDFKAQWKYRPLPKSQSPNAPLGIPLPPTPPMFQSAMFDTPQSYSHQHPLAQQLFSQQQQQQQQQFSEMMQTYITPQVQHISYPSMPMQSRYSDCTEPPPPQMPGHGNRNHWQNNHQTFPQTPHQWHGPNAPDQHPEKFSVRATDIVGEPQTLSPGFAKPAIPTTPVFNNAKQAPDTTGSIASSKRKHSADGSHLSHEAIKKAKLVQLSSTQNPLKDSGSPFTTFEDGVGTMAPLSTPTTGLSRSLYNDIDTRIFPEAPPPKLLHESSMALDAPTQEGTGIPRHRSIRKT